MIYFAISIVALALMYGLLGVLHLLNKKNRRWCERLGIGIMLAMMYTGCWFTVKILLELFR